VRPQAALLILALALAACSDDSGTPADAGPPDVSPLCGNGALDVPEVCDDGNNLPDDGCAPGCDLIDPHYLCPVVGVDCVRVIICGDSRIESPETCDDGDALAGDGCDAECLLEPGWTCPVVGSACVAIACGDGLLAGFETCDDGDLEDGDGCDHTCRLEEDYVCPTPGADCEPTVCGDGVVEGTEECEDGNLDVGDGCTPFCKREPVCAGGVCAAVCGDGVVQAPEEDCDDGNVQPGDGCSATCATEVGFDCVEVALAPPDSVDLPVTYRDFVASCDSGVGDDGRTPRLAEGVAGAAPPYGHLDMECYTGTGLVTGMVADTLGADGKPVRAGDTTPATSNGAASFDLWYRDDPDVNRTFAALLNLPATGGGVYELDSTAFFPLDGIGLDAETCGGAPCEGTYNGHNYNFTSEVRYWFTYGGDEVLTFRGDDDVWVFIDGHLVVDIGGVHAAEEDAVTLADVAGPLGLTVGGTYEAVVFQAERHVTGSNYRLTLAGFVRAPSVCTSECGDGVRSSIEACDDGTNDGSYGTCNPDCTLAPYCGDAIVEEEYGETCDDGLNLGGGLTACSPGCQGTGAACGDGVLQVTSGEQCDDGNTVAGDGCSETCQFEVE
jgi:fibro-slime domain-containing protein